MKTSPSLRSTMRDAAEKAGIARAEHFAPMNGMGVPRWHVAGWTRSTTIADEVESGPFRLDGPTKRAAE